LRTLAARAIQAARRDCPALQPQVMYIGNYLAAAASHQANLGSLLAESVGLEGIEGVTVEAAEASGAAAFHLASLAVSSGLVDVALMVGVEKYTDVVGPRVEALAAQTADYDYETVNGMTPAAQAGLLMQRYLYEYGVSRSVFAGFPLLAHANAAHNSNAMYRKPIRREAYDAAPLVSDPLNLLDVAPYADGGRLSCSLILISCRAVILARRCASPGPAWSPTGCRCMIALTCWLSKRRELRLSRPAARRAFSPMT
jgi:acetyl-CoA C-acetyltransferase